MIMKKNNDYTGPEELRDDEVNQESASGNNEEIEEQKASIEDNLADEADPLEELQKKYEEVNDSYLRLHAEFDNFRKRTMKEKADIIKSGGERVLTDMLPFADDFALPICRSQGSYGGRNGFDLFEIPEFPESTRCKRNRSSWTTF